MNNLIPSLLLLFTSTIPPFVQAEEKNTASKVGARTTRAPMTTIFLINQEGFMKTSFMGILILSLLTSACTSGQQTAQNPSTIAAVFCDIDQKNYESAEMKLESLHESDPKNVDLQKLLAAVKGKMIKSGDKSAENVARVRKAIASYNELLNDARLSANEKKLVDSAIMNFYTQLGEEEIKKYLLTRASDSNRSSSDHVDILTLLAAKSWNCSFTITSSGSRDAAEIARAKTCTTEGLDYSNRALKISPDALSVLSYKTNLLKEAATIAGLEGRQAEKVSYQKQYDEAYKRAEELNQKAQAADAKQLASPPEDSFTPVQSEEESKDLTEFKAANSLADAASQILLVPLEVAPLPVGPSSSEPTGPSQSALAQQKYEWKTLNELEDLTIDLPDNITKRYGYSAASEGVVYSIIPTERTSIQADPTVADRIMNTLARSYTRLTSRGWLDAGLGNTFEMKLLKKDKINGEPQKLYVYVLDSCTERKEGVLVIQASKANFYTIGIYGAKDSDPRVQRFLSSIKVK